MDERIRRDLVPPIGKEAGEPTEFVLHRGEDHLGGVGSEPDGDF